MILTKVISTRINQAKRRLIKLLKLGRNDVQEVILIQPFGYDGNPIENTRALYAKTMQTGSNFVVGFMNDNQEADEGESRLYSVDQNGNVETYVKLTNNGDIELGGDNGTLVEFSALRTQVHQLRDDLNAHIANFNAHVSLYNAHIHNYVIPPSPTPLPTTPTTSSSTPSTPSTININVAELPTLKTP